MKVVGKLLKFLKWLLIVTVLLVVTLPLWIGPVGRLVAGIAVPWITGTDFRLGALGLNQYNGRFSIGELQLDNPQGFDQRVAVSVGSLSVDADMTTVLSDTVVLEELLVSDVFVSYVSNNQGEKNFTVIAQNASGKKGGQDKEAEQPTKESGGDGEGQPQEKQDKKSGKKVVINHLRIANVKVQVGPVTYPLPDIDVKDIGRDSGGTTMAQVWETVYAKSLNSLESLGAAVSDLSKQASAMAVEHAGKVSDAVSSGVDSVSKSATRTVDSVGKSATKTVDSVGKSATKAMDSVTDSTGKAVDAIKNLF